MIQKAESKKENYDVVFENKIKTFEEAARIEHQRGIQKLQKETIQKKPTARQLPKTYFATHQYGSLRS